MKRPVRSYLLAAALCALAFPAAAQNAQAVATAKADLERAGVPLAGACGAAKITNLVAWRARPAYGLLFKAGGNRAVLKADGSCLDGDSTSEGGYATDYVIVRGSWVGFDLLGDGGGANNPQWAGPEEAADMVARNAANFREPIDPSGYLHGGSSPAPTPTPQPGTQGPPGASGPQGPKGDKGDPGAGADLAPILARLAALEAVVNDLKARPVWASCSGSVNLGFGKIPLSCKLVAQ